MSKPITLFCGNEKEYLNEELIKESNASNGGPAFRIPSLVNAGGTLVAAIDRACTGADWGYIELAVRTSTDGGETWSDIKTIAAPPAREISTDINNTKTAFFIDPCMAVAPNGDIVLLVTFFPESKGFHNMKLLKQDKLKSAYSVFDGKRCSVIYDRDDNYYLVLDDGTVLDSSKAKTPYKIKGLGELYKNDEYVGNIFLNGAMGKSKVNDGKTTFGAPLKAPKRSYVYMLKSSDKGQTWSEPKDITGSIINPNDGVFLAIAPGSGLTTKSGRIIMPLYTLKGTVAIYSDDNGCTWQRNQHIQYSENIDEWTAIEAPNGDIYSFGRAKTFGKTPCSVSGDNGISWTKEKRINVKAPRCQKNAIVIGDEVFISHPSGKKRENGIISIGKFEFDRNKNFKGIKWTNDKYEINKGFFAYSCMAEIDSKTIGILYEDQPSSHIVFDKIEL